MRVAYVLRYYPTLSETFVVREILTMQRAGVEVVVVAMGSRADGELAQNLPVVEVLRPPRRRAIGWLRRRVGPIDQVHAHFDGEASCLAQQLAADRACGFSVTLHAVDLFKPRPGIRQRLTRANAVFTVCRHHQVWLRDRYDVEALVAPCGVDVPTEQANPSREPARVVSVARDVPKKDLVRLRLALKDQPHQILSARPHSEVVEALRQASVFALPCRVAADGDRDGVPVSMMEAMAMGVPVVTRPIAGIPELVDATVGWIGLDFEKQLLAAIRNPAERARRGAAARARIAESWSTELGPSVIRRAWGRVRT